MVVADNKRKNAAYSGDMGDGGAKMLEDQVDIYRAGMSGRIPPVWLEYHKEFTNVSDPEYQKYLELKKKFE